MTCRIYLDTKYLQIKEMKKPTGIHTWLILWKASRAVEAHARRSIARLHLCGSDFGVLEVLLHKGPLPVNTVGKKVLLTSGSITAAVDRLERKGLVERRASETDRRARLVHLTGRGRQLIQRAFGEHAAVMEEVVSVLTASERATLVNLLRKLGRRAGESYEQKGDSR
ncbi:MAG: MarR family transcriptional regulator [Bryobacterales bacterium]|nr:MarR family transcriptional regulator [Bryobacterales bacterium]